MTSTRCFALCLTAIVSQLLAAPASAQLYVVAKEGDTLGDGSGVIVSLDAPLMNHRANEPVVVAELRQNNQSRMGVLRLGPVRGQSRILFLEGTPSPDGNGNIPRNLASALYANKSGAISAGTYLSNTLSPYDTWAIFSGGAGVTNASLVVRGGQVAPDSGGAQFYLMALGAYNGLGHSSFHSTLRDTSGSSSGGYGIWRARNASDIVRIAGPGDAAPGGGTFDGPSLWLTSRINAAGKVAFISAVDIPGDTVGGIYAGTRFDALTEIARDGRSSPRNNGVYGSLALTLPIYAINDAGNVAFAARYTNTTAGAADNEGLVISNGQTATEIVRKGDLAPDGNGRYLNPASTPRLALNNRNEVAFRSGITGASGGADSGIFVGRNGTVTQIARTNGPVPGGGAFDAFGDVLELNNTGMVLFDARIDEVQQRRGLFYYKDGVLGVVAKTDDVLPGFGTIQSLDVAGSTFERLLNDADQAAFPLAYFDAGSIRRIAIVTWSRDSPIFKDGFEP